MIAWAALPPKHRVFNVMCITKDPEVQGGTKRLPYTGVRCEDDRLVLEVVGSDGQGPRHFAPEQVIAITLEHLKEIAEKALGREATRIWITVPDSFSDFQRKAILAAATLARLEVMYYTTYHSSYTRFCYHQEREPLSFFGCWGEILPETVLARWESPKFAMRFALGANGVLDVTATDEKTGGSNRCTITSVGSGQIP